jgi:phosphoketolase
MDGYWRACNYLSAGMIYLRDNPLLGQPLKAEHIKNRLLGHRGSDPRQSFTWVHLNRLIKKHDLNVIYISGHGHGAPAVLANAYLEGHYSEIYPNRTNHHNLPVRGYKEKGKINTPLELAIENQVDRVPRLQVIGAHVKDWLQNQIIDHIHYAHENGIDPPEITKWRRPF